MGVPTWTSLGIVFVGTKSPDSVDALNAVDEFFFDEGIEGSVERHAIDRTP